ncbi:MAG: ABC transporter ATP-binding protein [Planctomycetota bacterium]
MTTLPHSSLPSPPPIVGVQPDRQGQVQATMPPALEALGIKKSYRIGDQCRLVLDGIDFRIDRGETVFLSGPSGSGKSTLLSIMGFLLSKDEGELFLDGVRVDGLDEVGRTSIRRERIGFVFQRFQLIQGLSAEDNVAIPLTLDRMGLAEARAHAGELLARVGLADHRHALPSAMSPGQCQRVALARAVIARPNLILADEPTAALDGDSGRAVMELLRELTAGSSAATVVVTHDPRILPFADRVCEMENGRFK